MLAEIILVDPGLSMQVIAETLYGRLAATMVEFYAAVFGLLALRIAVAWSRRHLSEDQV